MKLDRIVWWLKKDFRLEDNPALTFALSNAKEVLPVFVLEPSALSAPETSAFHVAVWLEAIKSLRTRLRKEGGDVCVLYSEVVPAFDRLRETIDIKAVVSHVEIGSDRTFQRDRDVAKWCGENEVEWTELRQTGVFRRLRDRDERSNRWKQWMSKSVSAPRKSSFKRITVPKEVMNLRCSKARKLTLPAFDFQLSPESKRLRQRVTEEDASATLKSFMYERGIAYSGGISSPNSAFTAGSRLSVHLAWGTISPRTVMASIEKRIEKLKNSKHPDAGKWRRSLNSFKARMHWRDHFIQRLETEPSMEFHALNRAFDDLPTTRFRHKRLKAWVEGKTGFPLVDACLRCTATTGFLNFRMRCMITSVACHAMRLDWREIMWPMARLWADYEPGIHIAQLQMQAGVVGINTLRTYNPAKQIADHDPDAKFVKRWVPELRGYSAAEIIDHQIEPLSDYIQPIVDWKKSSSEMRKDYFAIRREDETKRLAAEVLQKHGSRKPPSSRKRSTGRTATKAKNSPKPRRRKSGDAK